MQSLQLWLCTITYDNFSFQCSDSVKYHYSTWIGYCRKTAFGDFWTAKVCGFSSRYDHKIYSTNLTRWLYMDWGMWVIRVFHYMWYWKYFDCNDSERLNRFCCRYGKKPFDIQKTVVRPLMVWECNQPWHGLRVTLYGTLRKKLKQPGNLGKRSC